MQSSRDTTENPSADKLYAALTRKLKKTSAKITERKLANGEYVLHGGKVVPASLVEEKYTEAFAEGAITGQHVVDVWKNRQLNPMFRYDSQIIRNPGSVVWTGSRKTHTAALVEATLRQPLHVMVATPIRQDGSQNMPRDGQLFAYDLKSKQMIPVIKKPNGLITRARRKGFQTQLHGNMVLKVK